METRASEIESPIIQRIGYPMTDANKVLAALKNALVDDNMVGLVLQQILKKTGLTREKAVVALSQLQNEGKIIETRLTVDQQGTKRIYSLKKGVDIMKEYYMKQE